MRIIDKNTDFYDYLQGTFPDQDIVRFNDRVRKDNKWGTNPWTSWYRGWEYAGLEEIPVPGGK